MGFLNCRRFSNIRIYRRFPFLSNKIFICLSIFALFNTITILRYTLISERKSAAKFKIENNICLKIKEKLELLNHKKTAWIKMRVNSYCDNWKNFVKKEYRIEENSKIKVEIFVKDIFGTWIIGERKVAPYSGRGF